MMTERRTMEWWKVGLQVLVLIIALIGAYYKLDARVQVIELEMRQALMGYQSVLKSMDERMARFEKKLDCIADKRFCGR